MRGEEFLTCANKWQLVFHYTYTCALHESFAYAKIPLNVASMPSCSGGREGSAISMKAYKPIGAESEG